MKEYRHKAKNEYLKVITSSNSDGDCCGDIQYILEVDKYNINTWMAVAPEHAEWVRNFSTPWYNADFATPTHYFKAEELEVVEVEIVTESKAIDVKIPTVLEVLLFRLEKEPKDFEFYNMLIKEHLAKCEKENTDPAKVPCNDYFRLKEYCWAKEDE